MGHRSDFAFNLFSVLKFFLFICLGEREKKENWLILAVQPLKNMEVVKAIALFSKDSSY